MKKLLIATDFFLPRWDGVARFLNDIIPELSKEYKITVLVPEFEGQPPTFENTKIIRFPLVNFLQFDDVTFTLFNYKKIKRLVAKADIVWTQDIGPICMSAIRAAHKLNKNLVSYVHTVEWEQASKSVSKFGNFVHFVVRHMARRMYNKCDLVITSTREVAKMLDFNKIRTPKVVTYLGIKPDKFAPPKNKSSAKEKIGINPEKTVIGFVGRIALEKDIPTLLRAFMRLEKKHHNLNLLIVGEGLIDQTKKLDRKKVILAGSKNDVVPYYQAMDIYVLPSLTESSSLTTMEAMSCGLPVIATKVGLVRHYIEEKENGLLFPKRNNLVLQMKLEMLINDKKLRKRLGKSARNTIMKKYQWQTTVERIKKILAGF